MLVQAWGEGEGLNHSTNAFIHLRNSAINFAADAGTFGKSDLLLPLCSAALWRAEQAFRTQLKAAVRFVFQAPRGRLHFV